MLLLIHKNHLPLVLPQGTACQPAALCHTFQESNPGSGNRPETEGNEHTFVMNTHLVSTRMGREHGCIALLHESEIQVVSRDCRIFCELRPIPMATANLMKSQVPLYLTDIQQILPDELNIWF